jgi:hypothetical protein
MFSWKHVRASRHAPGVISELQPLHHNKNSQFKSIFIIGFICGYIWEDRKGAECVVRKKQ